MTDQNFILKGRSPQSDPHEKNMKIHDLTQLGSNLRPIACEANDVPLRHSGEASRQISSFRRNDLQQVSKYSLAHKTIFFHRMSMTI